MILRHKLNHLALFALFMVAACHSGATRDDRVATNASVTASVAASAALSETGVDDSYRRRRCPRGIQACSPEQEGQVCNPNEPFLVCFRQDTGAF